MVRKEAEKIACKWSLVSKWTSFFLAEEPYLTMGEDPFMDGIVEVEALPGEDLLEPRGSIQHIAVLEPASVFSDPYTTLPPMTGPGSIVIETSPLARMNSPLYYDTGHFYPGYALSAEPSTSYNNISENLPVMEVDPHETGCGNIFAPIFEVASTETFHANQITSFSRPRLGVRIESEPEPLAEPEFQ